MKKIIFMGTPHFAVPVLESLIQANYEVVLVVTQPDRPVGRKRVLTAPPVKEAALKHNIPVYQPEKLKDSYETLFTYDADLIVTAAYGQLLPKELLEHPPLGCINVHASLLPKLRGGAPIHYAILQGEKETGISIMYMAEKLDAGDIISQKAIRIEEEDHVGSLHDKLSEIGAQLLIETLPALLEKTNDRVEQDETKATFAANIAREQEKIDFTRTQEEVYNHIRGLHPWPVAYTTHEGKTMKVWWGKKAINEYPSKRAGEIAHVDEEAIYVVCGDKKAVRITEVQLAGKKKMSVKELLRGNKQLFQVGQVLE
ncbi:MAG TPA: methionyl-tRNA formyltransferase [Candidatus Pseudogracilibacillus intestinigallinarum]|uniref:Methionyl-tRNA formyltransferase n=1 Tax=Candidatus Pseudogracilibacillus intestinigallinarum TaxID=2838742 RepID=A0A9D1PMR7_9BACI|nr:methionyl-tRNA formyltransferase [Candidatus Pseudogracilibacillus intestinigallinarum]